MIVTTCRTTARRLPGVFAATFAFGLLFPGSPASAAKVRLETAPALEESAAPVLRRDGQVIRLRLDEAIEIALRQNLGLEIERYSREQTRLGINQAKGIFDLGLAATSRAFEQSEKTTQTLAGADVLTVEGQSLNLQVSQLISIGGRFTLQFDNSRNANNNQFSTLNPTFNAGTTLSYTMPLLRGLGREATTRPILLARIASDANRYLFETQVADLIQRVENSYWSLVEAQERLRVAEESLALAKELHRRNQIQVDVGTLPPLELVRSEANMATRQEDIISSRAAVGDASDQLRQLLNIEQGEAWSSDILPETDPRMERPELNVNEAIRLSLAARSELRRQETEIARLELEARLARQQTLPQLDLSASYGLDGKAGTVRRTLPNPDDPSGPGIPVVVARDDYFDALDNMTTGDTDNWSIGLNFSYPLQNREARAQKAIASLAVDAARIRLREIEQQIITEVRTAARQAQTAAQQIDSAGVSRKLQEKNLEAEQKRYENGLSTSFEVTRVQEDLNAAKSREVSAVATYRRALAEYYRAIGHLLDQAGVELSEPAPAPPVQR